MNQFEAIIARAHSDPKHIVMAEGQDPRVVKAGLRAQQDGIAHITFLGRVDAVRSAMCAAGYVGNDILVVDPETAPNAEAYAQTLVNLRKEKGIDLAAARQEVNDPLVYANLMVRSGDAAGSIAGAVRTTADVVRYALQLIGPDDRYSLVSSFFIMVMEESFHDFKGCMIFADCALVVDPDEDQLAQIASATADSASALLNLDPKVAMLSFSTRRSAEHDLVEKVDNATNRLKALRPDLPVEGGIQFDAGIVPEIGNQKAPGSSVAGRANVLVFPDLNSGNIGYKIAERIGKAKAIGPILQGLAKPANDLSRGCSIDDIYSMIAVTGVQAQAVKHQLHSTD